MRPIDADKALEIMQETYCKDCEDYSFIECEVCLLGDVMSKIADMPVVETKPVRYGKWIRYNEENICSECHKCNFTMTFYCPYCGVKMDGGEESE